jgi:hypothetical protein
MVMTGLFLGAGFSYEAGMPLAWDLTAEIKGWLTADKLRNLNECWKVRGTGFPDGVIEDVIGVLQRPEVHYEALLGYVETQSKRSHSLLQEYHGIYSWLVELVYHILYYRHIYNVGFLNTNLKWYEGFKALCEPSTPLWVFSLNHDLLIELIAARLEIRLYSGFTPEIISLPRRDKSGKNIGELKAEVIRQYELERHAMRFPNPFVRWIYLLKIHGSLDIFTFNNGKDLLKILPQSQHSNSYIESLRAVNEELFYPLSRNSGRNVKSVNEITYADNDGEMQFLRRSLLAGAHKFDSRHNQVLPISMLKHFRENINFVSRLICIGYSFGDMHINAIFREWLEFSADRKLEIVDPSISHTPSFLLHVQPQISITKSSTTDYFDALAGIKRTMLEKSEKYIVRLIRTKGKNVWSKVSTEALADNRERLTRMLVDEIKNIPIRDGKQDFEALGGAKEYAEHLLEKHKLGKDEVIADLIKRIEGN